jgi:hypothetical protein
MTDSNKNYKMCGEYHYPRNYLPGDPTHVLYGQDVYFVDPLDAQYSSYNYRSNLTSNRYLCNILSWTEGDYIDDAGLGSISGVGVDSGFKPGRHIRINYPNVMKTTVNGEAKYVQLAQTPGEGIYVCYNEGSCLGPDLCSCTDGYSGVDW